MPKRRAFIVAIETYAQMEDGLARTLAGTHQAATSFRQWLIDEQGLAPADIYFCAEDAALPGRTAGATRDEIVDELSRLKDDGKDRTDELYFLYVGHGLCYKDVDGVRLADILLAADYRTQARSGNTCLKIDEVQRWLRLCMGPADHFYFIDACRNDVSERDIKVGALGLTYDNSFLGIPTVYTLFSAAEGTVAAANSGFVDVLIDALNGAGRAKVWRSGGMAVLFRSAKDYVERKLVGQAIDQRVEGGREGVIREITPPPTFACSITVDNAGAGDAFVLTVADSRNAVVATLPFTGTATSFARVPDDYTLSVSAPGAAVEPIDPLPADLYENRTVRFVKRPPMALESMGPAPSFAGAQDVAVQASDATRVELRHLQNGDVVAGTGNFSARLAPGRYAVETLDLARGVTLRLDTIEIDPGAPTTLDLRAQTAGPLRHALLAAIPGAHLEGVDFSESLGPTADQGMDLWLALIGASRVVGDPSDYSKLGGLPLSTFDDIAPGQSAVYLLAGIEPMPQRLGFGLSSGAEVELEPVAPHPVFPGLFEQRVSTSPGYAIASFQIDDNAPVSLGICMLPDCATMLTVTADGAGGVRVQQLILPMGHLADRVPAEVQRFFGNTPLRGVRQIVEVQRRFSRSAPLDAVLPEAQRDALLRLEWFEPMIAVLACYELARRGRQGELRDAVTRFRPFLERLPDSEALARMAGLEWRMPGHPPLVLDGFLSLNMAPDSLPLDAERIDYRGPWTAWAGAVRAEQRSGGERLAGAAG